MKRNIKYLLIAFLFALEASSQGYNITATGPDMNIPRKNHLAFLVDQNRAIVIGGRTTGNARTYSAEVFNHISNTWTMKTLPYSHVGSTVEYIGSGKYIIMGGGSNNSSFSWYTTIYDAVNDTFYPGPTLLNSRVYFSSARLLNNRVLVAGGNLGMSTVTELYDIDSNKFIAAGPLSYERAYAMILPTNDGNAYVFGGIEFSSYYEPVYQVEEYHTSTNSFSTVSSQLIPNDPGWEVFWSSNAGMMQKNRLSDGRYVFLIHRNNGDTVSYKLLSFDPASKIFALLNTTPSLPDYNYSSGDNWRLAFDIVVDENEDYIYIDAFKGTYEHKLLIVDASTGELAIPINFNTYYHDISSASKFIVPSGEIAYTGGANDSLPNSPSDDYTLIEPLPIFGITELPENAGWFYAYPNPVEGNNIYIEIPEMEIDDLFLADIAGRIVKRIDTQGHCGDLILARGNLDSGIYFVVLLYNGRRSVARLILK